MGLLERAVLTFGHSGAKANSEPEPQTKTTPQPAGSDKETKVGRRRHRDPAAGKPPNVKVQCDPERIVRLGKLEYCSIQIGIPTALSPE